jgi:hypothetical protein
MAVMPSRTSPELPATCATAFKEWSGICAALADGRQSIIIRKGGIAEGPGGFSPEHEAFWLYPTRVHEAQQGLRVEPTPGEVPPPGFVRIDTLVAVATVGYVDRPEALDALAGFHLWTAETIRKRFEYRRPGLWVLGVRAYRRPEPWAIEDRPDYAGCKTWVPLDGPLATAGAAPALDDEEFDRRLDRLREALAPQPGT